MRIPVLRSRFPVLCTLLLCVALLLFSPRIMASTPQVDLRKSVTPESVDAGGSVCYTISLENSGDAVADGVSVVDTLPDGFSYEWGSTVIRSNGTAISDDDPTVSGNELMWASLEVPAARTSSFYGMHTFAQDKCNKGYIEYQLDRVLELMGPGAYVKQLFYYITPQMTAPLPCWVDFINEAYDRGLIPIVRLQGVHGGQHWVKPAPDSPGDYTGIANVYRRIVELLPRRDNRPLYVEIWNEPNLDIEWSGEPNPVEYAEFLVDTAGAIRGIGDHRIRILNGALSPGGNYHNLEFIDAMASVPGALNAFDVWSTHPYPGNHPPEYNIHDGTAAYPDLTIDSYLLELERLAAHGRGGVQVILTETGHALGQNNFWFEGYAPIGEQNRADYIARAFRDYWSRWPEVLGVCPYELVDPYGGWWVWDWLYPDGARHWQYDALLALDKSVLPQPAGNLTIEFRARAASSGGWYYNDVSATASNVSIGSVLHTAGVLVRQPTATPTPTHTPTPGTPTPTLDPSITPTATTTPVCADVIVDGSFETGDVAWNRLDPTHVLFTTEESLHGEHSVRLGLLAAENINRWSSVRQRELVDLPADAGRATLDFWYYPVSTDPEGDWAYCYIRRGDQPVGKTFSLDLSGHGWMRESVNLSEYLGDSIEVRFTVHNDGEGGTTAVYIDQASLLVCGGQAVPSPTWTPTHTPTPSPSSTSTMPPTPSPTVSRTSTTTPTMTPSPTETSGPTATLAPTRTATRTEIPTLALPTPTTACTELLTDGGFEDGGESWSCETGYPPGLVSDPVRQGTSSMRLGIVSAENMESYSSIRQTVALPPDATSLLLSFWYYPLMEDASGDLQYVLIMEEGGDFTTRALTSDARDWQYQELGLSAYAGQSVTLYFSVYNDGLDGPAAMYVDEVSLAACWGEVSPTSTPTVSPAPTGTPTSAPGRTPSPRPTPSSTPEEPVYALGQVSVGRHPHGVAVDPATGLVYTANYMDGTVSVVDPVSGSLRGTIDLGGAAGGNGIAINGVLRRAYVANSHSDNVSIIDLDEQRVVSTVPVQRSPDGIAVDSGSGRVYVACFGSGSVSVIDGLSGTPLPTVPVGTEPSMVAVSHRKREVYVTNHHHLFNSVSVIDAVSNDVVDSLPVDRGPYGVALNEKQDTIYTANRDGQTVSVISRDGTRLADVSLGSSVYVVAYNPNTHHVFALCAELDLMYVVDGSSFEVLTSLPVGNEAEEGIAVDVATNRVYVTNGGDDTLTVIQDVGPLPFTHVLPLVLKGFVQPASMPVASAGPPTPAPEPRDRRMAESLGVAIPGVGGMRGVAIDPETGASYYAGERGVAKLETRDGQQNGWYRACPALVDLEVSAGRLLATSWEDASLLVFDADGGALEDRVGGFARPSGVAAGLGRIFVADTGADRLIVLDELTYGIIDSWPVDDAPTVVDIDEAGGRVHVACVGGNSLTTFDVGGGQLAGTIFMGGVGYPQGMAVDSLTGRVFVSYTLSGKREAVAVIDGRGPRLVSVFPTSDLGPVSSIYALAIDERERLLVFSTADALLTVDINTGQVRRRVRSLGVRSPFGLGIDAEGQVLQVDLKGGPVLAVSGGSER